MLNSCGEEGNDVAVDCNTSGLNLQIVSVDYTDCGISNGRIRAGATGGGGPYTFSINSGESNSTGLFENLATDYYLITVRDRNNCSISKETFVGSKDGVRAVAFTTNSGCQQSNGSISVTVRNGVEPYTYQLGENGDYQSSNEFFNLPQGTYSLWVKDSYECGLGIYVDILSGVSFKNEIEPIISASCATANCHDGTVEPDLSTLSGIQSHSHAVLSSILDKSMPPVTALNADDILRIECWIKDRAPDN